MRHGSRKIDIRIYILQKKLAEGLSHVAINEIARKAFLKLII